MCPYLETGSLQLSIGRRGHRGAGKHDRCPYGKKSVHPRTAGRRCEDTGRRGCVTAEADVGVLLPQTRRKPGMPEAERGKGAKKGPPLAVPEGAWPPRCVHFGKLAWGVTREWISVGLIHQVGGTFLQQSQETETQLNMCTYTDKCI